MRAASFVAALLMLVAPVALAEQEPLPKPRHEFMTAGSVLTIGKDPLGRIWLGGTFTEVDGLAKPNIVRLLPDGNVDPDFTCAVNGPVRTIVFDNANRAYIAGAFTEINGASKLRLARMSLDCVLDTGFPVSPAPNGSILALGLNGAGDALWVGGAMSSPSQRLVRYNTATGLVAPGFGFTIPNQILALASDGGEGVYVGGTFTSVNGQTSYARLAHLLYDPGTSTSSIDTSFAAAADSNVNALVVTPDTVIAGGAFTTIGGNSRGRLARILRSNGSLVSSFQPVLNGNVRAMGSYSSSEILVAGVFDRVGSRLTGAVARINLNTGEAAQLFAESDAPVIALMVDGTIGYVGGTSSLFGDQPRSGFGAFDFAAGASVVASADAAAMSSGGAYSHWRDPDGSLWIGGSFLKVDGQPIAGLVRMTPNDQIDPSVNLNIRGRRAVFNMTRDSAGRLYFGGELERIGNQPRAGIGRLLANNTLDPAFTFNLRPRSGQLDVTVFKMLTEGNFLYVLGDFEAVQDPNNQVTVRTSLAKIDLQTNTVVAGFDPLLTFLSSESNALQAIALDSTNRRLYIGGTLTAVDGTPRNRLAAIHLDTGELINSFVPGIEGATSDVWEIALDQMAGHLYVGGFGITGADGVSNTGPLLRLATATGLLDPTWSAGFAPSDTVEAIALDDQNWLYVGGILTPPPAAANGYGVFRLNRNALAPRFDIDFTPASLQPYQLSFRPSDRTVMISGFAVQGWSGTWNGVAALSEQGAIHRDGFESP